MKTTFLNRYFLLIVIVMTTGLNMGAEETFKSTKTKNFSQSFNVTSGDKLQIDNKYGNVNVSHWDKNEVLINVTVTVKSDKDTKSQDMLDRIQVELKKNGNVVSGVTSFKNSININGNISQEINYNITMPSTLDINIDLKYGNLNLPDRNEGKAILDVKYGAIKAGSFTKHLSIDSKYSNITLGDLKEVSMDLGYCGKVKVGNAEKVSVDTKYSNLEFIKIDEISMENKYGDLKAEEVRQISFDLKYGNINIGKLKDELKAKSFDYSNIVIKELNPGFKTIEASGQYATMKISVPSSAAFRIVANNMKYGSVNISGLNVTESNKDKTNHDYKINKGGNIIHFDGRSYSSLIVNAL